MTIKTLFFILLAAVFHSIWNIMAKKSKNNLTLLWLQMLVSIVCILPVMILHYDMPPKEAWPTLLCSGILQAAYYFLLSKCYQIGNLSIVYPLTRGSAPVFVCLFSVLLGIESLTLPVIGALFLTVFGIYLVNMPSLSIHSLIAPFRTLKEDKSTRISGLVGITIALYTLSDKISVQYTEPLVIYFIIAVIPACILAPKIISSKTVKTELIKGGWFRVCLVSLFTFLAYYLVLYSMKDCNASYVSSIREVSVVFVTLYTSLKTKDSQWKPKVTGAVFIFLGIFLISYLTA